MATLPSKESGSERRLAAIMFTDMVGYSSLSQKDEVLALRLLEAHRSIVRPLLIAHRGREIKTIGDAFLVEFESALDAVHCAVDIQRSFHQRNAKVGASEQIRLRIGLHVGDVVHRDQDVYGDGVNIASRVEPFASPGGICLTEDVARQVQNKVDHRIVQLGARDLKNISMPVRLYSLLLPWERGSDRYRRFTPKAVRRSILALTIPLIGAAMVWYLLDPGSIEPSGRRIAVLPLEDLSPEKKEAYFVDGITEELISKLAHISGLEVIAHASTMQYRPAGQDMGNVGRDLNAGSVLHGSVRPFGDRARIVVRLIEAASGRVVWTDEYDRELRDVLAVQTEIALQVSQALEVQLVGAERARLEHRGTESPEAHRLVLLGRHHLRRRTTEDVQKAAGYFDLASKADPMYVDAWVGLAECNILFAGAGYGNIPRERAIAAARTAVMKALELRPHSPDALAVLAYLQYRLDWNWAAADSSFAAAVSLKPGDARIHEWRGLFLALRGDTHAGVAEMEQALTLDPRSASVGTGLGRLLAFDGQFDRSIEQLRRVIEEHPQYAEGHFALGLAYGYAGRSAESIASLERAVSLSDRRPIILADLGFALARSGREPEARAILHELDSLGRYQQISPWVRSIVLLGLGEVDRGLDLMEDSFAQREGLMVYLKSEPMPPEVRNHPRFREFIRRIGLEP